MSLEPQQAADHVLAFVRQSGLVETDPVDFVEFLLAGVTYRDLDAIADDIVAFVVRYDDLCQHVKDRLEVQRAFREDGSDAPATEPRRAAETIVKAIHAIVSGRLARRNGQ